MEEELTPESLSGDRPRGAQLVGAADAQFLGVHRAIEVDGADLGLTKYVRRDFDDAPEGLWHKLQDAAVRGGFILLTGSSSVGKSRSAYEAIAKLFPRWWLLDPDPDDPLWRQALSDARVAPTIVWLDELERYFEGAHAITSGQVRSLLRAEAQIVLIGTLSSDRYAAFTAPPGDFPGPDPWRRQREVLALARPVQIPDAFSNAEYERADLIIAGDPRLAAARRNPDYGFTQSIAAAPQLVARWRNADIYAAAVLNAAVDARRIGVLEPVTKPFLKVAATAYCDNRAQAKAPHEWLDMAIGYCTHVLDGAAAALEPVARGMGEVSGYRVAEYLYQHVVHERRHLRVPEHVWQAALDYSNDAHIAARLAQGLYQSGDIAATEKVTRQALVDAVEPDLFVDLHCALAQCCLLGGRSAEALAGLSRAMSEPGISAQHRARLLVQIARTHSSFGEVKKAGEVAASAHAAALEASDSWAIGWSLRVLGIVSAVQGRTAEALDLFGQGLAVTQADPDLTDLGLTLQFDTAIALGNVDRYKEAFAAAENAVSLAEQAGMELRLAQAHCALGQLLFETGRWDEALDEVMKTPDLLKDPSVSCGNLAVAAVICFHRGENSRAREHLVAAVPQSRLIGTRVVSPLVLARSLESELRGLLPEALSVLAAGFDDDTEELEELEDLLPDAVRLAIRIGELSKAGDLARLAGDLATDSEVPHRQANALYCYGLVNHDGARLLEAAERYDAATRPLGSAQALAAAVEEFVYIDDLTQAEMAFNRAIQIYTSLDAVKDVAELQAKFRNVGGNRSLK